MFQLLTGHRYSFVVEQIIKNPERDHDRKDIVTVSGRRGGLLHLLLSFFGINTRCSFHLTKKEIRYAYENKLDGISNFHSILIQQKPSVGMTYESMGLFGILFFLSLILTSLFIAVTVHFAALVLTIMLGFAFACFFFFGRAFVLDVSGHSVLLIRFQAAYLKSEGISRAKLQELISLICDTILETTYEVLPVNRVPLSQVLDYQPPKPVERVPVFLPDRDEPETAVLPLPIPKTPPDSLPVHRTQPDSLPWYGVPGKDPMKKNNLLPAQPEALIHAMKEFSKSEPNKSIYKQFMGHLSNAFRDSDPELYQQIINIYNTHKVKLPDTGELNADQIVGAMSICDLLEKLDHHKTTPRALQELSAALRSLIK